MPTIWPFVSIVASGKGGGEETYLFLVVDQIPERVAPARLAPVRHEGATHTRIHEHEPLISLPELPSPTIMSAHRTQLRARLIPLPQQRLPMSPHVKALIIPLQHLDILDLRIIIRTLLIDRQQLLRIRVAVKAKHKVRRRIQPMLNKKLEVPSVRVAFGVHIRDQRFRPLPLQLRSRLLQRSLLRLERLLAALELGFPVFETLLLLGERFALRLERGGFKGGGGRGHGAVAVPLRDGWGEMALMEVSLSFRMCSCTVGGGRGRE